MPDSSASDPHDPGWYEIRLQGHLAPRWAASFDGLTLTARDDGTTVLNGPIVDQAALHGVLSKLRDIGLPLVSVTQVHPDLAQPTAPHPTAQGD
ncbi:MAG TPA: hypothetical protein VGN19_09735 [Pedococcus sp.]|jgi:hypothetical protein|nr:hypothetical protein [Pedococcus sp.]